VDEKAKQEIDIFPPYKLVSFQVSDNEALVKAKHAR